MRNKWQFPKVLTLVCLFLLFSLSTGAQSSRNPKTDLSVGFTTCSVTGQIKNYRSMYRNVFTLILYRDNVRTELKTKVRGSQYTIPNVPEGTYEIRGSGYYEPNKHAIFAEDSQEVTCSNGQANSVNFRIDSGD